MVVAVHWAALTELRLGRRLPVRLLAATNGIALRWSELASIREINQQEKPIVSNVAC
jgi:hypothetical protein